MTNIIKSSKTKKIAYICLAFLLCASISTFITIFWGTRKEITVSTPNEEVNDDKYSEYTELNINNEIVNNAKVNNLISYSLIDYEYYFDINKIDKYLFDLINSILVTNKIFNDNVDDYEKIAKYKILQNEKVLIVNLFLHNKLVKSKKFLSFFKLKVS